jgi:hypothetical protein
MRRAKVWQSTAKIDVQGSGKTVEVSEYRRLHADFDVGGFLTGEVYSEVH